MSAPGRAAQAFLVAGLVTLTASAQAAEDAGTQSIFAQGAGNRAVGMGSALVASVSDASALLWNPGGLGLMQRAELQAVQTGDLGAGVRESFVAFAIPSWQWGGVAFSFRHIGADGIEQRDDRNVLLADDLGYAETEMALGYGRSFGDAISLGAAVRMHRQSVAGFNGSGIGADLGLVLNPGAWIGETRPWARGLTWGVAVRNVVEPRIRLDQEGVPDPAAISSGIAYRTTLRGLDNLVLEVDVEKARGSGVRPRAGIEYRLMDFAALRAGLNGSRLAAGTAFHVNGVSLDYAFENGELEASHRFGVTLPFGASVTESHRAAQAAEDEVLERRLASAFQERQRHQIDQLLMDARARLDGGDTEGALQALTVVVTLDPGNETASELQAAAFVARGDTLVSREEFAQAAIAYETALGFRPQHAAAAAGAERARAESDRRGERSREIREIFARAMDAFVALDLLGARDGFAAVLQRDDSDGEARRMLERTEEAIRELAATLVAQAQRFVANGLLDEAEPLIAEAGTLDPASPAVARVRRMLRSDPAGRTGRASGATQRPAAPSGRAGAPMSEGELATLYERGMESLKQGHSDDALRYWELVWSSQPDYRQVSEHLSREYLARGMEAFAAGRLEEAMARWKRVLELDPNNTRATGYLERARKQMARSREILGAVE